MELLARIELATSPLPRECSTPELQEQTNNVERVAGIEPAPSAWKAEVLPLNHTRKCLADKYKWWWEKDSNLRSFRGRFTVCWV